MMLQGWRWYGPDDPVSLDDIRQAGATDVVTALHQVPIGEAWTRSGVEERKHLIEKSQPGRSQLTWSVVESIPVPDDVKRLGAKATRSIEAWIASLEAVAAAGIKIICYNFMPVVDWCRTDLEWELPNGAKAMRGRPNSGRGGSSGCSVNVTPSASATGVTRARNSIRCWRSTAVLMPRYCCKRSRNCGMVRGSVVDPGSALAMLVTRISISACVICE